MSSVGFVLRLPIIMPRAAIRIKRTTPTMLILKMGELKIEEGPLGTVRFDAEICLRYSRLSMLYIIAYVFLLEGLVGFRWVEGEM